MFAVRGVISAAVRLNAPTAGKLRVASAKPILAARPVTIRPRSFVRSGSTVAMAASTAEPVGEFIDGFNASGGDGVYAEPDDELLLPQTLH